MGNLGMTEAYDYDANGNLIEQTTSVGFETRSYLVVIGLLAGVAALALVLRLRPGRSA